MNRLREYRDAFRSFRSWSGRVPPNLVADFWGILTNPEFNSLLQCEFKAPRLEIERRPPQLGGGLNGESWFEAINWLAAASDARRHLVMISLGAHYGAQLVGVHRMLQLVNPTPCILVAVEAEPGNFAWISQHMRDNGIDPAAHWLLPMAISDSNEPVLFPVGAAGTGSNNCYATNAMTRARSMPISSSEMPMPT